MSATVWTIGYERLRPESLVAELAAAGVTRVLDVRIRPQSRKPGMSKTRLTATLAAHGIAYEHRRALGTPPELRELFRRGRIDQAGPEVRAHVEAAAGAELDALADELAAPGAPRTALLCLEEEPAVCHRRVLTDALRARRPGLRVVDL